MKDGGGRGDRERKVDGINGRLGKRRGGEGLNPAVAGKTTEGMDESWRFIFGCGGEVV